jgi:plasmid stabilization system protein ParE
MKIRILPLAESDLDKIYDYYANKSVNAAIKIYNSILEEITILSDFPLIASIEELLSKQVKEFRSLVVLSGKYKVIYYVENDYVNVTHIWDCRQNPKKLRKIHAI